MRNTTVLATMRFLSMKRAASRRDLATRSGNGTPKVNEWEGRVKRRCGLLAGCRVSFGLGLRNCLMRFGCRNRRSACLASRTLWSRGRLGSGFRGEFLLVEVANNARYVGFGFVIGRNAAVLLHSLRACVMSGQRLDQIKVIALQQFSQVTYAAFHIGLRIKCILYAQLRCGPRHQ